MNIQHAPADERLMANAIRALAMDAVQAANSGHPGMPMGMADVATVLFNRFITLDPAEQDWANRDRFVLSAGHGSMLLYAVNHLLGYDDMGMDQIRGFRQLGSRTAGHPEYGHANDHRPSWPGDRNSCRHGIIRETGQRPLSRPDRSLHLCHRGRRLPDGGRQPRGD